MYTCTYIHIYIYIYIYVDIHGGTRVPRRQAVTPLYAGFSVIPVLNAPLTTH
jgi:hypothetical protein